MINISITMTGLEQVQKQLDTLQKQLPYIAARSATTVARQVQQGLSKQMTSIFDKPTPFIQNSLFVTPATKSTLIATVAFKDRMPNGNAPEKYIKEHIAGGKRNMKPFERRLVSQGVLPAGMKVVPGREVRVDRFGNMSRKLMTDVLHAVSKKQDARSKYFIADRTSHLAQGVWERLAKRHIRPVMLFVNAAEYQRRFHFYELGKEFAYDAFPQAFNTALEQALATAR